MARRGPTIRYTEGIEDGDLTKNLLTCAGLSNIWKDSTTSTTPSGSQQHLETRQFIMAIETQDSLLEEEEEEPFNIYDAPLVHEPLEAPPQQENKPTTTIARRPPLRSTLFPSSALRATTVKPPLATSSQLNRAAGKQVSMKRAPLLANRIAAMSALPRYDSDFPEASAASSSSSSSSSAAGLSKRPVSMATTRTLIPRLSGGLSASKAPSAKPLARPAAAAQGFSRLSDKLAQVAKKSRVDSSQQADVEQDADETDLWPEPNTSSIFSTPPRAAHAPVPTGSTIRRRLGADPPQAAAAATNLTSLLRTARTRVTHEYSGVQLKREARLEMMEHLVVKPFEVELRSAEHLTLTCHVVDKCSEPLLTVGDVVTCIVPLLPYDPRDHNLAGVLKSMGHVSQEDPKAGVLALYRPWKIVHQTQYEDVIPASTASRLIIVCSGLVLPRSVSSQTAAPVSSQV